MKFRVSEDVDAPRDVTFARFVDFREVEAEIVAHGAELSRAGSWLVPEVGRGWRGAVRLRGRLRPVASEITALQAPDLCEIRTRVGGMDAVHLMTFTEMRADMTRVQAVLDLSAGTLSARLALQTLKLARGRVLQRLQGHLARQGTRAEDDYHRARG